MTRKIYSWQLSYEEKAIEKSDIVIKFLFNGLYEVIKDNHNNAIGMMYIDKDIRDIFNHSGKKVSILVVNELYSNFNICE